MFTGEQVVAWPMLQRADTERGERDGKRRPRRARSNVVTRGERCLHLKRKYFEYISGKQFGNHFFLKVFRWRD